MDDRDAELEPVADGEMGDDDTANDGMGDDGPPSDRPDPAERLRGLVVYMASSLVDEPGAVEVEAERRGAGVHLTLRVPEAELGKVIGRQGRIARAMRTALMVAGSRDNVRASLDIEG
jgi:predicted RNA-binding protein YlqC (UPF0109 family)